VSDRHKSIDFGWVNLCQVQDTTCDAKKASLARPTRRIPLIQTYFAPKPTSCRMSLVARKSWETEDPRLGVGADIDGAQHQTEIGDLRNSGQIQTPRSAARPFRDLWERR
jgi:hypothetical protein